MALHEFKALSAGTLSNPYRYVAKDEIVLLSDAEAKFHEKKSKWLRPLAEVKNRVEPPIMPHLKMVEDARRNLPYAQKDFIPPSPQTSSYNSSIAKIMEHEKKVDSGAVQEPGAGAAQEGTGNADPLA